MAEPIPHGFHTITPNISFKDSQKAIDFYKKAFDAKVVDMFPAVHGKGVMHATLQIGDSMMMLGDEMGRNNSAESLGGSPLNLYLYTKDADAAFEKAVRAGCTVLKPMTDM